MLSLKHNFVKSMLETGQTCGQVLNKLYYFVKVQQVVLKMWEYGMIAIACWGFYFFRESAVYQKYRNELQGKFCSRASKPGLLTFCCMNKLRYLFTVC